VLPDGTSSLVARGMLNLAHRESREQPSPLAPGEPVDIEVMLEATSWTFEAGHRVRLDLAGTDWPNAWAPPAPLTLTVDRTSTTIELPVIEGPSPIAERPVLPPPDTDEAEDDAPAGDAPDGVRWSITHEALTRVTSANAGSTFNEEAIGHVPWMRSHYDGVVSVSTDDPGKAAARAEAEFEMRWPEATVISRADVAIESDAKDYRATIDLAVYEDGEERFRKRWERSIPRDLT
jgi:uncharacterized protein